MYARFAETSGWKVEVMSSTPAAAWGDSRRSSP